MTNNSAISNIKGTNISSGNNIRFREFYNRIYWGYDFFENLGDVVLFHGQLKKAKQNRGDLIELKPYSSVLSVSCGTGGDFMFFPKNVLPTLNISCLDISEGMLKQCRKRFERMHLKAEFYVGLAEALPFVDNSFDHVFSFGGINYFDSPSKAVSEMIRVAKPGSRIYFGDETEELLNSVYRNMPVLKNLFKANHHKIDPFCWLPENTVKLSYQRLWNEKMYVVSFEK